jgi:hypothetical protein
MDIEQLAMWLEKQGPQVTLDRTILTPDILDTLYRFFRITALAVDSANLVRTAFTESKNTSRKKKLAHAWVKGALEVKQGKIKPGTEEGDYRWRRFLTLSAQVGFKPRDVEQTLLRFTNDKLMKMYRFTKETTVRRRSVTLTGTQKVLLGSTPVLLNVTAVFREQRRDSSSTEYEIRLAGFPGIFLFDVVPGLATPVWHGFQAQDPILILCSGPFNSVIGKASVPLEPGVNFAVRFQLAPRLNALAGSPGPMILCGSANFHPTIQGPPLVQLSTYPSCSMNLGVTEIEKARLIVQTQWVDGSDPDLPDSPGGEPDPSFQGTDLPALYTRVAVGGLTEVAGIPAMLWSDLPADTGMLLFNFVPAQKLRPLGTGYRIVRRRVRIDNLNSLTEFVGQRADWLTFFPFPNVLAQGAPYLLRNLSICFDLGGGLPVNVTIHVVSSKPFEVVGLSPLRVEPFEVAWNISFPMGKHASVIYVTAGGTLHAGSVEFDAVFAIPSFTIHASSENDTTDLNAAAKCLPVSGLHAVEPDSNFGSCTGLFLDLHLGTQGAYRIGQLAAVDAEGRSLALE